MKNLTIGFGLIVLLIGLHAQAKEDVDLLCEQHSQAHLVGKIPSPTKDPCDAQAKIQAIAYECGVATDTYEFTQDALAKNIDKAKTMCEDYCEKQSGKCTGVLDKPFSCGLSTPSNRALDVGTNMIGCPKHCKGQAFNYCSLYHGNFFGTSSALFTGMAPNCHCRRK
jgi:hypothetical protein